MQGDFQDAPPEKLGNILIHLSGPDTRGAQSCINQVQKPQCELLSILLNPGFVSLPFLSGLYYLRMQNLITL